MQDAEGRGADDFDARPTMQTRVQPWSTTMQLVAMEVRLGSRTILVRIPVAFLSSNCKKSPH